MSIIEKALDKLDGSLTEKKAETGTDLKIDDKSKRTSKKSKIINLDLESMSEKGFLTSDSKNKVLFEQYRRIKMPVLQKAFEDKNERNNIIMVTSSIEGEGKSFTSINLAMSIAYEYNYTVLLVDADITKKMSSRILGMKETKGIVDYLTKDKVDLSDLIIKTNLPKLNILPSGNDVKRITELFNSKKMEKLLTELSNRYSDRIIIIDTPPLLQDSSSEAIKKFVHQVVFVIEAEKTPQHIIERALELVSDKEHVGIVLNKSNQKAKTGYYYNY